MQGNISNGVANQNTLINKHLVGCFHDTLPKRKHPSRIKFSARTNSTESQRGENEKRDIYFPLLYGTGLSHAEDYDFFSKFLLVSKNVRTLSVNHTCTTLFVSPCKPFRRITNHNFPHATHLVLHSTKFNNHFHLLLCPLTACLHLTFKLPLLSISLQSCSSAVH